MKFLTLSYSSTALLLLKCVICSKTNDVTNLQDSDELKNMQDLTEKMEMSKLDENVALKEVIKNENFVNLVQLMEKAYQAVYETRRNDFKTELAFHDDFKQKLQLLTKETLIKSKSLNRKIYKLYLKETIQLIDKFIPLFKNKKDKDISMRLPNLIKNIVLKFKNIKDLLPNVIELFNESSTKRKSANLDGIRETFILLRRQIEELEQESDRYWEESIGWIIFYNDDKIQPSSLKTILEELRDKLPLLKKKT
ncbi:hypothetical protein NBO_456g0001 [Nosema bombycis CQ1]|uniref:Uncharacterized protein n=1 Tax=Nosema bombycis (strain CQ1 / CVCC 102059) TaxID=578461 RepID=R0KQ83_NOSB1|nr:hypothetical protein NBO_456g0001 [Nosema bombycis CQ1]|eukprot:EOB12367.1 hypothetical protein NBO_456g0001 [Nosema bombycis CQ1]